MYVLALLRQLSQRSYQSQHSGNDVIIHQLVLEVDKPLGLLTVDVSKEHNNLVDAYKACVGKTVLVPMVIENRDYKGKIFRDVKTADDGKLVVTAARSQAAA